MAATFQTIPTADPSESAFVLTVDDNLITPATIPAMHTRYADWVLGQRERTKDTEWDDYIFVDTASAAPGRRAFVFGKSKSAATVDTPYETFFDSEPHEWPVVITQQLKILTYLRTDAAGTNSIASEYFIKSATKAFCVIKVERFQNALPWDASKLRHPAPITDDLSMIIGSESSPVRDCLHGELRISQEVGNTVRLQPSSARGLGYTVPATNFTDWRPYVLRDSQKQSNGLWVREKVTVFPPITAKRKLL